MVDTLFADVSEFQVPVNDSYPYAFLSFRVNDGTYRDKNCAQNLAWSKKSIQTRQLLGFISYFVWETNWQETVATFKSMVGVPHHKMSIMIDVESWGGRIQGDHSAAINATREDLINWLQANRRNDLFRRLYRSRDRKRVIVYGNAGDLNSIYPNRGDAGVIIANYSMNPTFPGKIAHQFGDDFNTPPFGKCDINSADGVSPADFVKVLGLDGVVYPTTPSKIPVPAPRPTPKFPLAWGHRFGEQNFNGTKSQTYRNFIKSFQVLLVKHGYAGRVSASWSDGVYGPETTRAVKAFQKAYRMKQTGNVGRPTWIVLFSKLS